MTWAIADGCSSSGPFSIVSSGRRRASSIVQVEVRSLVRNESSEPSARRATLVQIRTTGLRNVTMVVSEASRTT